MKEALAAAGLLVLLALVLYFPALSGHWRWDDPQLLLHGLRFSVLEELFNPQVWRQISTANLMPWQDISIELDLILFGLRPGLFYLHHLLALAAAGLALYACLRLWVARLPAAGGALLFMLGAPVLLASEQLMTRHYIEGLVFCLLALMGFVQSLRTQQARWLIGGALCYLLAVIAKEIYVPLVVLLPFIREGDSRQRLRAVLPYAVIAACYVVWRYWMLGTLGGGYVVADQLTDVSYFVTVLTVFARLPFLLFGAGWPLVMLLLAALLLAHHLYGERFYGERRARAGLWTTLVAAALVLGPLIPLVQFPGITTPDRFLFLPWAALCFALAFYAGQLAPALRSIGAGWRNSAYVLTAAVMALALWQGLAQRSVLRTATDEFDAQSRFLWTYDDSVAFLPSENVAPSFWFIAGTREVRRELTGQEAPRPLVDPLFLDASIDVLFVYDRDCRCMREASGAVAQMRQTLSQTLRSDVALEMDYEYDQGTFEWRFGPYTDGSYTLVSEVLGALPAPRAGRLRFPVVDGTPFYLRYTSPEGWVTYSPLQTIRYGEPVSWQR